MSFINIQPFDLPVKQITKVKIELVTLTLFTSAVFNVLLYTQNDELVDFKQFLIDGNEYLSWNNDDQFIQTLLLQKAGYTRI